MIDPYEQAGAPWRDQALVNAGYAEGLPGVWQYTKDLIASSGTTSGYVVFMTNTSWRIMHTRQTRK